MSRLKEQYKNKVIPKLQEELGVSNTLSVPKIEKITINMGLGSALGDKKVLESALEELSLISSQKPVTCLARKSVASFKLREGNAIGCKVTLRKERMYEFLDRLVNIALPRVRDFRGLNNKSFDGSGNYALGIKEQIVFPEIEYDKVDEVRGMDIIVVTTAKTDDETAFIGSAFYCGSG